MFFSSVGTGVCVLTGAYRLFFTNSITEPKVRKVAEIPGNILLSFIYLRLNGIDHHVFLGSPDVPNSWAVVCEDRQTHILLSKATEIYYMSESEVIQKVTFCS